MYSENFFGGDIEIFFAKLFRDRFIVSIINISEALFFVRLNPDMNDFMGEHSEAQPHLFNL